MRFFFAGKPLVRVPKPRSGSKYSGQHRFPQKLKLFWGPKDLVNPGSRRRRRPRLSTGTQSWSSCRWRCPSAPRSRSGPA